MGRPYKYTLEKFLAENPDLAEQWDSALNQDRLIQGKYLQHQDKYGWKCAKGHPWKATLSDRLSGGGCPVCSGHKVLKGVNDLQTLCPQVAAEWDYERNEPLLPDQVTVGSNKRVNWICSKGHQWNSGINHRVNYQSSCPYCASRKLLVGFNDLATTNPALAEEWDYNNNKDLTPHMVMAGADRMVWWRCKQGHSWKAKLSQRNAGSGCPICSNRILLSGFNDLATHYPNLAEEWDRDSNDNLLPTQVLFGSAKRYWWKCAREHSYQATIQRRKEGNGCPYCSGRRVLAGFNDLATTNPQLSSQWDCDKNKGTSPQQVSAGVSRKFWWKCVNGHSWEATINSRSRGGGCPYCCRRYASEGENDLLTVSPVAENYWDVDRNHGLQPGKISAQSTLMVWWKCGEGHHWRAMVRSMTPPRCPYCAGIRKRQTKYIT